MKQIVNIPEFSSMRKGNFGLGLSISKNVVEKNGGGIKACSSAKGASFSIVLGINSSNSHSG